MEAFLGDSNGFRFNVTKEGKLFLGYHSGKDWFYTNGDGFGYNFLDAITEGNWSIIIKGGGLVNFWDESQEG